MRGSIVVIEDEPEILRLLGDVLEMEGFSVIRLARPERVWDALENVEPELFLVDIMLPGMSGIEVAEQLRRNGYEDTPMIAMSASRLMSHVASGTGYFAEAIDKPFELDSLIDCVERVACSA